MDEIRKQEIGVEFLLRRQVGVRINRVAWRIRQQRVVLHNQAQRKLGSELPIPFAANNVVVENAFADAGRLRESLKIGAIAGTQARKR